MEKGNREVTSDNIMGTRQFRFGLLDVLVFFSRQNLLFGREMSVKFEK